MPTRVRLRTVDSTPRRRCSTSRWPRRKRPRFSPLNEDGPMKLLFTNEWLQQRIAADPDADPEAGPSITGTSEGAHVATIGEEKAVRLRIALGVLVRQLRMKEGLTLALLAERAEILEDQLRQVEHDPHYTASPRLIF